MRPAPLALSAVVAVLFAAQSHAAAAQTRYLDLVNTSPVSIAAFAVAAAGSGAFRDVPLSDGALRGGGESVTVALDRRDGCLRDLRATFADGRVLLRRNFDVCRWRSYHTGRSLSPTTRGSALTAER